MADDMDQVVRELLAERYSRHVEYRPGWRERQALAAMQDAVRAADQRRRLRVVKGDTGAAAC